MKTQTRAMVLVVLTVLLSGLLAATASAKPSGPGPGNSPNAKACQKGGWKALYTSTGDKFTSESQCVSYSANGGTLLTSPPPPPARTLTVSKTGTGAGTVTGSGIDCGTDCTEQYPDGTPVTLEASAADGSTFTGWSGACSGMTCTVTMSANQTVTATFDITPPPPNRTLTVSKTGTGTGTVTGTGIDCGDDCTEGYADGTPVTLTATEAPGSTFTGWSGDCTGMTCTLSMTTNKTAVANFDTTPPAVGTLSCPTPPDPATDPVPDVYDFGTVVFGRTAEVTITCTVGGGDGAQVTMGTRVLSQTCFTDPTLVCPYSQGVTSTCPEASTVLVAPATCTVVIRYSPAAIYPEDAAIAIPYNDGSREIVRLTGRGTPDIN